MKTANWFNFSLMFFFVGLACISAEAAAPTQFAKANKLYEEGNFESARALYEKIVRSGDFSADLFYNLGNTNFRLGDVGKAALNFRRAIELEPHHAEAKANLEFVRDAAHAKIATPPSYAKFFPVISESSWTIAVAAFGWSSLFFFVSVIFARRRAALWFGAVCCILLCAYSLGGLFLQRSTRDLGVVVTSEAEARLAPTKTARLAERLPAASEIQMLATRGQWTFCELPNGTRAWVPTVRIAAVRPAQS